MIYAFAAILTTNIELSFFFLETEYFSVPAAEICLLLTVFSRRLRVFVRKLQTDSRYVQKLDKKVVQFSLEIVQYSLENY